MTDNPQASRFVPNSFQVPNAYVDEFFHLLTCEEKTVLIYFTLRILGFQKRQDRISLSQLVEGITTKSGKVLDHGTGLSRHGVLKALAGLRRYRLVLRVADNNPANEGVLYGLQLDSNLVDLAGLEARSTEVKAKAQRRTAKGRTAKLALARLSDRPPLDESVGQTTASLCDRPLPVCRTDTQKTGERKTGKPSTGDSPAHAGESGGSEAAKKASTRKPWPMFDVLAEVIESDGKADKGWIAKTSRNLEASGHSAALVKRAYGRSGWWYTVNCAGMERVPTPSLSGIEKSIARAAKYYRQEGVSFNTPTGPAQPDQPESSSTQGKCYGAGIYV
jgi:hypothetical protein